MNMIRASVLYFSLGVFASLGPPEGKPKQPGPAHFSILGVTIGSDNMATLQSKLGRVEKCRTQEHVSTAGYANSKEVLVFEFGEVGGGDVTAFYLSLPSLKVNCPLSELSVQTPELITKGGIHLGMTEDEFAHIFGTPMSRTPGGHWKYEWTWEAQYTEKDKKKAAAAGYSLASDSYLVGVTIEARFAKGVLQYFYISKLETT